MEFLQLAPDIDSDPDLEAAGWWAARVYELLLKVSALKDLRGNIPREFQNYGWLARRWNFKQEDLQGQTTPEDMISVGVERLLRVGKLYVEDGCWVIRGWEAFYKSPKKSTERVREFRDRQKGRVAPRQHETDETDETPPAFQDVPPVSALRNTTHSTPPTPHHPPTGESAPVRVFAQGPVEPEPTGALQDGLMAVYLEEKGVPYEWGHEDDVATRAVSAPVAEVLRRWRIALRRERYPVCATVSELKRHWKHYATDSPGAPNVRKGTVRAEDEDWSNEQTGTGGFR